MKHILQYSTLFICTFLLFACNKDDEEPVYATKFHYFLWDADTIPLTVSSSAFEQTFHLKDFNGNPGGIIGVPDMQVRDQVDSVVNIRNTTLKPVYVEETGVTNYINSIVSDTIKGKWFTIINEEEKQLRIILDENKGTEKRSLAMLVWTSGNPEIREGHPACDQLIIYQLPAKSE